MSSRDRLEVCHDGGLVLPSFSGTKREMDLVPTACSGKSSNRTDVRSKTHFSKQQSRIHVPCPLDGNLEKDSREGGRHYVFDDSRIVLVADVDV